MHFRCGECFASTWLDLARPASDGDSIECQYCAKTYVVQLIAGPQATIAGHYNHALKLANASEVDMASAYSVMLGILTLDEARFMHGVRPGSESDESLEPDLLEDGVPRSEPRGIGPAALTEIDPDFLPAVKEGALSFEEALRRGDRGVFAARLQARHRLSRRLSYRVTDNRISLRAALAEMERPKSSPAATVSKPGALARWQAVLVVGLVLVAVSAISATVWNTKFTGHRAAVIPPAEVRVEAPDAPVASPPQRLQQALRQTVEVVTDPAGNVTQIIGSDPKTVLRAYCEASLLIPAPEPVAIADTSPASRSVRLGVFRDFNALQTLHAIRIRRDHRTRRWTAGVGRGPIPTREVPLATAGATSIPVSAR